MNSSHPGDDLGSLKGENSCRITKEPFALNPPRCSNEVSAENALGDRKLEGLGNSWSSADEEGVLAPIRELCEQLVRRRAEKREAKARRESAYQFAVDEYQFWSVLFALVIAYPLLTERILGDARLRELILAKRRWWTHDLITHLTTSGAQILHKHGTVAVHASVRFTKHLLERTRFLLAGIRSAQDIDLAVCEQLHHDLTLLGTLAKQLGAQRARKTLARLLDLTARVQHLQLGSLLLRNCSLSELLQTLCFHICAPALPRSVFLRHYHLNVFECFPLADSSLSLSISG